MPPDSSLPPLPVASLPALGAPLNVPETSARPRPASRVLYSDPRLAPPARPVEEAKPAGGILNADTIEGLKYFAEIRKRHAAQAVQQAAPPKGLSGTLALADYGSDDE